MVSQKLQLTLKYRTLPAYIPIDYQLKVVLANSYSTKTYFRINEIRLFYNAIDSCIPT